jgi:hypothetical protein
MSRAGSILVLGVTAERKGAPMSERPAERPVQGGRLRQAGSSIRKLVRGAASALVTVAFAAVGFLPHRPGSKVRRRASGADDP